MNLKNIFSSYNPARKWVDYCGVTFILTESLKQFGDIIIKANSYYKSQDLQFLNGKITEAIQNKCLIYFSNSLSIKQKG